MVNRNYRMVLLGSLVILSMVFASPVLATDGASSSACLLAEPLGVCGDGVCDAYTGETKTSCPRDCKPGAGGGGVTEQPTVPPLTSTPTATATSTAVVPGLPLSNPTATVSSTQASSGTTSTTDVSIPTSTPKPGAAEEQPDETTDECGLVAYESRPAGWRKAYIGSSDNFVPKSSMNEEVFVCDTKPVGQICIPIYEGLMTKVQGQLDQIMLVDCASGGTCELHKAKVEAVGGNLCATVTPADNLECSTGCAFLPDTSLILGVPVPSFLRDLAASQAAVPAICVASMLVVGLLALIIFGRRRRKSDADAPTAEQTPGIEAV